jgi:preprotein translocase subunit SecD
MRTRAATLVALLSITLVTGGCQVVGLLPLYLGVEQADIAPTTTVGDLCLELRVALQDRRAIDATAMEQVHAVVAARVGMAGIANPSVGRDGDHLVVVLPGPEDGTEVLDALSGLLTAPGVVVFLPVPETRLGTLVDGQPLPDDMTALPPIVDSEGIASARVQLDEQTGSPLISLELTTEAAAAFDDYASAHFGEQVAIVVDGVVINAPTLNATEFGGQIEVSLPTTPAADRDALDRLVAVVHSGPLPLPLEEGSVGPCR